MLFLNYNDGFSLNLLLTSSLFLLCLRSSSHLHCLRKRNFATPLFHFKTFERNFSDSLLQRGCSLAIGKQNVHFLGLFHMSESVFKKCTRKAPEKISKFFLRSWSSPFKTTNLDIISSSLMRFYCFYFNMSQFKMTQLETILSVVLQS